MFYILLQYKDLKMWEMSIILIEKQWSGAYTQVPKILIQKIADNISDTEKWPIKVT